MAPNMTLRKNTADIPWHAICEIEDPLKMLNECNFAKKHFTTETASLGRILDFIYLFLIYLIYMCK